MGLMDELRKMQEETDKMIESLKSLMGGGTPSIDKKHPELPDNATPEEKQFVKLERKYHSKINDRANRMKLAQEKISRLEKEIERLEEKRAATQVYTELHEAVAELTVATNKLRDAQDEYDEAEGGEPYKRVDELLMAKAAGKSVEKSPFPARDLNYSGRTKSDQDHFIQRPDVRRI